MYVFLIDSRGVSYRLDIWIESWDLIQKNFWFGAGLGSELIVNPSWLVKEHIWSDTHNLFLAIWYYSGLFGVLLLSFFGISVLTKIYKNGSILSRVNVWVLAWLTFIVIESMTDGDGLLSRPNEHWFSFYIPIMFVLAQMATKGYSENNVSSEGRC